MLLPNGSRLALLGAGSFAIEHLAARHESKSRALNWLVSVPQLARTPVMPPRNLAFAIAARKKQKFLLMPAVNTVVIATRHHLHAQQVLLPCGGKARFLRKAALPDGRRTGARSSTLFARIQQGLLLMVGFNRRFAPMAVRMKAFVDGFSEPLALHYRVNAGPHPADHWVNDPEQGGGRILGEVCHFMDFLIVPRGRAPVEVQTRSFANPGQYSSENVIDRACICERIARDNQLLANGDRVLFERASRSFRRRGGCGAGRFSPAGTGARDGRKQVFRSRLRQDKGHRGEWEAFAQGYPQGAAIANPIRGDCCHHTDYAFVRAESRASGQPCALDASMTF